MRDEVHRMSALVENLLDMAHIESGDVKLNRGVRFVVALSRGNPPTVIEEASLASSKPALATSS